MRSNTGNTNSRTSFGIGDVYDSNNLNHSSITQKTPPRNVMSQKNNNQKIVSSHISNTLKPLSKELEKD